MQTDYLVYEHWRTDTNMPFYVGKGNARNGRAREIMRRQKRHRNVVEKVLREGGEIIVKIVEENLPEESAFAFEKMKIAYWRAMGAILVNHTDGGDGVSGYRHTEEMRTHLSTTNKGRPMPDTHRERMLNDNPMKRPDVRAKVSGENAPMRQPAMRERMRVDNPMKRPDVVAKFLGDNHPMKRPENRAKISGDKHHRRRPEERARISGEGNPMFGRKHSPETRAKIAERQRAAQARKRAEKELCGVAASSN